MIQVTPDMDMQTVMTAAVIASAMSYVTQNVDGLQVATIVAGYATGNATHAATNANGAYGASQTAISLFHYLCLKA